MSEKAQSEEGIVSESVPVATHSSLGHGALAASRSLDIFLLSLFQCRNRLAVEVEHHIVGGLLSRRSSDQRRGAEEASEDSE